MFYITINPVHILEKTPIMELWQYIYKNLFL